PRRHSVHKKRERRVAGGEVTSPPRSAAVSSVRPRPLRAASEVGEIDDDAEGGGDQRAGAEAVAPGRELGLLEGQPPVRRPRAEQAREGARAEDEADAEQEHPDDEAEDEED